MSADRMIVSAVRMFISADGMRFAYLVQRYEMSVERQWVVPDVVCAFPTACAESSRALTDSSYSGYSSYSHCCEQNELGEQPCMK